MPQPVTIGAENRNIGKHYPALAPGDWAQVMNLQLRFTLRQKAAFGAAQPVMAERGLA